MIRSFVMNVHIEKQLNNSFSLNTQDGKKKK